MEIGVSEAPIWVSVGSQDPIRHWLQFMHSHTQRPNPHFLSSAVLLFRDVFNRLVYFGSVGSEQNNTKLWFIHDASGASPPSPPKKYTLAIRPFSCSGARLHYPLEEKYSEVITGALHNVSKQPLCLARLTQTYKIPSL